MPIEEFVESMATFCTLSIGKQLQVLYNQSPCIGLVSFLDKCDLFDQEVEIYGCSVCIDTRPDKWMLCDVIDNTSGVLSHLDEDSSSISIFDFSINSFILCTHGIDCPSHAIQSVDLPSLLAFLWCHRAHASYSPAPLARLEIRSPSAESKSSNTTKKAETKQAESDTVKHDVDDAMEIDEDALPQTQSNAVDTVNHDDAMEMDEGALPQTLSNAADTVKHDVDDALQMDEDALPQTLSNGLEGKQHDDDAMELDVTQTTGDETNALPQTDLPDDMEVNADQSAHAISEDLELEESEQPDESAKTDDLLNRGVESDESEHQPQQPIRHGQMSQLSTSFSDSDSDADAESSVVPQPQLTQEQHL